MTTIHNTIKQIILYAPSRCGRIFYECRLDRKEDKLSVRFLPTSKYYLSDDRLAWEALLPDNYHFIEKYQQTGMAIGTVEHFLKEQNINYTLDDSDVDNIEFLIDQDDREFDLSKYEMFSHANRSFDIDTPVDPETVQVFSDIMDKCVAKVDAVKVMIQDKEIIKKIYYMGNYNRNGENNGDKKITQLWAPLLMSMAPKIMDHAHILRIGRTYSEIGLTALERGYALAFCNNLDYEDPRFREVEDVLFLKYDNLQIKNLLFRGEIAVGNKLRPDQPYNYCWVRDTIFNSVCKTHVNFIKDLTQEQISDGTGKFKLTIKSIRPLDYTEFWVPDQGVIEYIDKNFIQTGKLLKQDEEISDDKLTQNLNFYFDSKASFDQFVWDEVLSFQRRVRLRYCIFHKITMSIHEEELQNI
jgi:hypothetical protein